MILATQKNPEKKTKNWWKEPAAEEVAILFDIENTLNILFFWNTVL